MAPHKKPTSLLDLARNEVGKLVLRTCLDIDVSYSYNDPLWQEQVDSLQALLVEHIPASQWDNMCDVVFKEASQGCVKLKDSRVIYATLVHRNTKKLVVKPLCELTKSCRFYSQSYEPLSKEEVIHRDFWLQLIGKLVNIVDLDMSDIDCDEIYAAIGTHCIKLEKLCYGCRSNEFIILLENCTKLRFLKYYPRFAHVLHFLWVHAKAALETFPKLEDFADYDVGVADVLETVVVSKPLNLRCVRQVRCSPLHISIILPLCPNLTALDIFLRDDSTEMFKILATSSIQLTHLTIYRFVFDENFVDFLKIKGRFILSFKMSCEHSDLNSAVLSIALYCTNLITFIVEDSRWLNVTPQISTQKRSLFKHLEHFEYSGLSSTILDFCLSQSTSLLSLKIMFIVNIFDGIIEDELIELLSVDRLAEIVQLRLIGKFTTTLMHHVFTHCPKMTYVQLSGDMEDLDNTLLHFVEDHRRYVRDNNLDLIIDFDTSYKDY